ncbi:unnamed protein product [Adineta ricciae]|uniref:Uncharacterized protein n=1 Tax=Adineta ricciae TaxID=249248 RepID=A0A815V8Q1_ADIRI|nr:unnamed protein product [Adineta ricciae]CAF1532678.1 unnamed protein product [Adineta ricciae]
MHFGLIVFLLGFVVLQQFIHVESLVSPINSPDNDAGRPYFARRLRAPLMGRAPTLLTIDEISNQKYTESASSSSSASNDEQPVQLEKRRPGAPLFGRRWINTKRRGPLFG